MNQIPLTIYFQSRKIKSTHLEIVARNIERMFPQVSPSPYGSIRIFTDNEVVSAYHVMVKANTISSRDGSRNKLIFFDNEIKESATHSLHYNETPNFIGGITLSHLEVDDNFISRLIKISLHEVGHMLKGNHCKNKRCIMNLPTAVNEETLEHLDNNMTLYVCDPCAKKMKLREELVT
jgi:aspartate carbamoyltransferase regulatory subunit